MKSETWPLRKTDENTLLTLEPTRDDEMCGHEKNYKVGYIALWGEYIGYYVCGRKHNYRLGIKPKHTVAGDTGSEDPVGKRPVGRPKKRRKDLVENRAMDRGNWRIDCDGCRGRINPKEKKKKL